MSLVPVYNATSQQISANNLGMFRNRIINGNMLIDQRGSATTPVTTNGYAMDRFGSWRAGTMATNFGQASLPAPLTEFTKCAKLTITTTQASLGASDYVSLFEHRIEGYNIADFAWGTSAAQSVAISFWIYASATGTITVNIRNGAYNRSYVSNVTITSANAWQYVFLTVPGDTSGTWNTTNNTGIVVCVVVASGATYQGTNNTWSSGNYIATSSTTNFAASANSIYVTGVQLEKGTVATPFEFRPFAVELELCQRYYETSFPVNTKPGYNQGDYAADWGFCGGGRNAGLGAVQHNMKITKRIKAGYSITLYNPYGLSGSYSVYTDGNVTMSPSTLRTSEKTFVCDFTDTNAIGKTIHTSWVVDAELI